MCKLLTTGDFLTFNDEADVEMIEHMLCNITWDEQMWNEIVNDPVIQIYWKPVRHSPLLNPLPADHDKSCFYLFYLHIKSLLLIMK